MTTAITVENLGKRYRLGHEVKRAISARYLKECLTTEDTEDTEKEGCGLV